MLSTRAQLVAVLGGSIVLAAPATTAAQFDSATTTADSASPGRSWIYPPGVYGAWIAGAHNSSFRTRTGVPGRRDFYLVGARVGWFVGGYEPTRRVNGQYFIDLLPLAVSTGLPDYNWDRRCRPGFLCPGATPIRHTVYAVGLAPLGWSLSIGDERVRGTLEASGGGLWFSRPVPDPEAARFNFTASVGPTVDVRIGPNRTFRAGYLWHHTSNGGRGRINPGLNTGILSVGLLYYEPRSAP